MRIYLLSIITVLLLAGCAGIPNRVNAISKSDSDSEQYAVYSALLNEIQISPEDGSPIKLIVINDQTAGDKDHLAGDFEVPVALSSEFQTAAKDYWAKNKESERLTRSFNLKVNYVLINKKEFADSYKGKNLLDRWIAYYQRYPNSPGLIILSRVGFDLSMTHAFVYVETHCGGLCGDGTYYLLTKQRGIWMVTSREHSWVS